MKLNISFTMALVSMASAVAVPSQNTDEDVSLASPLYKRDTYNCNGSFLCSNLAYFVAAADDALSKIPWVDTVLYGGPGSNLPSGVCAQFPPYVRGGTSPGVGIFMEGKKTGGDGICRITGNSMSQSVKQIRGNGCKACGHKVWDDGCTVTVNYVSACFAG